MSRSIGKKSDRSREQAKALEETKVDPAVTRLQATLEGNLEHFMNTIGAAIRDLDAKLAASKKACEEAHAQMGVSLTTALLDSATAGDQAADPATASASRMGTPTPLGAAAGGPAAEGGTVTADAQDADAVAAAAAIAAKVREADERRRALALKAEEQKLKLQQQQQQQQQQQDPTAPAAVASPTGAAPAAEGGAAAAGKDTAATTTVPIVFPDNTLLLEHLQLLKKDAYALGTTFDGIHDWVALNIPDYKEGDNDGVEIMGAVIQQVSNLQETVKDVYACELKYLEDRSEMEKALLRMPDSDTVQRQLEVLDLDSWDDIERGWQGMIRVSLILFTMLSKNMKVLREPRKQRGGHLFM